MQMWYDTRTLLAVFGLLFSWLVWDYFANRRRWRLLAKVPGLVPRPFIGTMLTVGIFSFTEPSRRIARMYQLRFGLSKVFHDAGMYLVWVGRIPLLFLTRASTVETLLGSNVFVEKANIYQLFTSGVGDGLASSTGNKWRKDRKLLTPAFHFRILDNFLEPMNEQTAVLVQKMATKAKGKDWIDPQQDIAMCAMDIICETALGLKSSAQKDPPFYALGIIKATQILVERLYRPWFYFDFIFNLSSTGKEYNAVMQQLHTFTDDLIEGKLAEKKAKMNGASKKNIHKICEEEEPVKKRLAFLDLILENHFSKQELRDQISTFIFAGFDTTATTMSWALYVLGLEQEVQAKMQEEIYAVLAGDTDRDFTMEDLKDLKYMECVFKELQRIYPTAPVIGRQLTKDAMIGGYMIPKDTQCFIAIASVHQDPTVFPEPERFDPDRFLPENCAGRNPYAFIPFSAGPRNCIGQKYAMMELKIMLCHILRAFTIVSLDPRDKMLVVPEIVLRPQGNLRIQFKPRNAA